MELSDQADGNKTALVDIECDAAGHGEGELGEGRAAFFIVLAWE